MIAYVLVSLAGADEQKALTTLKKMDEVLEAHVLFGEWDLLAKVEINDIEHLGLFMIEKVRRMANVRLTSTLIAAK